MIEDVKQTHPHYTDVRIREWGLMSDAYEGDMHVKKRGELYLPKPGGFNAMTDGGKKAYHAYRDRALFPRFVSETAAGMIGIAHEKEIEIQLPNAMEYLRESASSDGVDIETFHRRITRQLLVKGRYGVMADAPIDGNLPYLAGYEAASIRNWDKGFFVLDESGPIRDGFRWLKQEKYRVLDLPKVLTSSMSNG